MFWSVHFQKNICMNMFIIIRNLSSMHKFLVKDLSTERFMTLNLVQMACILAEVRSDQDSQPQRFRLSDSYVSESLEHLEAGEQAFLSYFAWL